MTATLTVVDTFSKMEEQFNAAAAAGIDKTFQFDIGDGQWSATIADGKVTIAEGPADSPDVTLTASDDDWVRIVEKRLNAQMAFMTGKLKVRGDLGLATKLQSLFL